MMIGLIGCGNMGSGMAKQLLNAGHPLTCHDPNETVLAQMAERGASTVNSASLVAKSSDLIILSLPNAAIVSSVMNELTPHIRAGSIVLDTSTSEPATTQALSSIAVQHQFEFVDGPVSGGPIAANAGTMTMLLGGERAAIDRLQPILDVLTAKTVVIGASGSGHAAKIANNMLCAANLVLVAEAVRLGSAVGVAADDLLEGINAGSGRSGVSEVNFPKWVLNESFDSGFTMGLMRKDVGLALKLAQSSNVELNGFAQIADIWLQQSTHIPDDADFNEIVKHDNKGNEHV